MIGMKTIGDYMLFLLERLYSESSQFSEMNECERIWNISFPLGGGFSDNLVKSVFQFI